MKFLVMAGCIDNDNMGEVFAHICEAGSHADAMIEFKAHHRKKFLDCFTVTNVDGLSDEEISVVRKRVRDQIKEECC